jgi:hypothetical protein
MKKVIFLIVFLMVAFAANAQTVTKQIAFGAKGVDSVYEAETHYYYVHTTAAQTGYYVFAIQAMTTRAAVLTGSDSCHISIEVSLDNSTWVKLPGSSTLVKASGGGTYMTVPTAAPLDVITTTTNGGGIFAQTSNYYPYIRVKFQHYKSGCTMYPTAWVTLKKY